MRIRRPRNIPTWQLMLTVAVGVFGGVYIYKPLFIKYKKNTTSPESSSSTAALTGSDTSGNR